MYDLIIVGAGSAGLGALGVAQRLKWKCLLVDKNEDYIGGDCLNFGCVPSKALIHVSKFFHGANQAKRFGLKTEGKADLQKVLNYIHQKQEIIRVHENADYLRSNGVEIVIGMAKFNTEDSLVINGDSYHAKRILLATGSSPRIIPIHGLERTRWYTNETIFYDLKELPNRLLVIGGGPIGCEMAQAYARLGSQVTIVNRGTRLLANEREEITTILEDVFKKEGIDILHECTVQAFSDDHTAEILESDGASREVHYDAVLLAVGRVLNYKELDFEKGHVDTDENGRPILNEYLCTSNKRVFFAGDSAGKYKFSHGAEKHIRLLAYNWIFPIPKKHTVKDLSWVTFTDPEVASFGYTEKELHAEKIKFWRQDQRFEHDDRAITDEYQYGRATFFFTEKPKLGQRKLLGGTMIAPNAGELIQELLLAVNEDISIQSLIDKVYAYPTQSRINQQTVRGVWETDNASKIGLLANILKTFKR